MEHYGKKKGILSRDCSKCGGDLGERYGKQRYCKACHASYMRATRPKHSQLKDEARKKANARAYANVYLRRGKIEKMHCINCGSNDSQMHHSDYRFPLLITWYCRECHLKLHNLEKQVNGLLGL